MKIHVPQTYEEFADSLDAIMEGRATELADCYLCPGTPLRGITGRHVANKADPTEVLHLTCGHHII